MAAPKKVKEEDVAVEAPVVEAVAAPKDVKVLSLRPGKVILPDKQELTFRGTVLVDKETADWLLDSFKPLMQIV